MSRIFLGVDGGQSGTVALIGDESGRCFGSGRAGPVNHVGAAEGREKFLNALGTCVSAALQNSGLPADATFEAACLGFSGGPEDKEFLTRETVRAGQYLITHDARIALAGATAGAPGVVVIAGTGSIAFGQNAAGTTARAGGWGYIFGDEGGGFDIVRQALRASLRAAEGWGPKSAITDALLESTNAPDAYDLLHRFYTQEFPRSRIAALATLVDQAACAGDEIAREILLGAARALATLAGIVRAQLFLNDDAVRVTWTGGVFQSALLRERYKMLVELTDGVDAVEPQYGPAAGALIEAYWLVGLKPPLKEIPKEK